MSQYNIGPKIGIEGEREFRAQISRINSEYRSMDSYLKALDKSMAQNGRSQEALAAKSNVLRQQIGLEEQRYKELSTALERAAAAYGENSQEALRFRGALLDVENTVATLSRELGDTEDEMQKLANGIDDVGESADSAEPKVLSFGDMLKAGIASGAILNGLERAGEMIVDIGKQAIDAASDVKAANAQFQQTFGELEGRATSALKSISDETGMAVTRLQGGYTALYAFTKSVGGDQETALNIAQRALSAAADSAAYYDRTMEDATETLQSFLKGNYANDAALGIAATETTRNAKANELYAKSFKDLTEAQKVDTLLAMVEAGNAASGALGQAAREADSWTNVTGELNEVWKQLLASLGSPILEGLTPLIQGVTAGLKELTAGEQWYALNQGVSEFRDGIAGAGEALASSNEEIDATAGLAERYLERLRELEAAGLTTEAAMREYAATVDLLNQLQPQLNLSIDETTGRLEQNTDQIYDNIRALRDQARQQAQQAYYADIVANLTAVQKDRYAAEMRLYELQAQQKELLEQGAQAVDMYAATEAAAAGTADLFWVSLSDQDTALYEVMLEIQNTERALAGYDAEIQNHEQVLDAAIDAQERMTKETEKGAGAAEAQSEAIAKVREAYEAAKTAARDSIDSQIGLFQELADENDWTAEKIIQNWEKQREAFSNYEDNLKKAVDMGLDKALVQQLSDGSQQSMMILDALVNDTEISIDEINTNFSELSKSKDSVSETMGDIHIIVSDGLSDIAAAAESSGSDIVDGAVRGIKGNKHKLISAMADLAKGGKSEWNHQWERNSPSRWMRRASDDIVDGGILQIERRIPDMGRAMTALAEAGQESYAQQQLDHVAQHPSMMQGVPGYGGTTTNTRNVAYGGISININTQPGQDAQNIADAVLEELTVRLGQEEASW